MIAYFAIISNVHDKLINSSKYRHALLQKCVKLKNSNNNSGHSFEPQLSNSPDYENYNLMRILCNK